MYSLAKHHELGAQTTEIGCLTALETRSPRARCWQGWFPPRPREDLPQSPSLARGWQSSHGGTSCCPPPVYPNFPPHRDTVTAGQDPCRCPHPNLITTIETLSPTRSHSEVLGSGLQHRDFRRMQFHLLSRKIWKADILERNRPISCIKLILQNYLEDS